MGYLLDTDAFSAIVKQSSAGAARRLADLPAGTVAVSVVTLGEVAFGLRRRPVHQRVAARVEILRNTLAVLALGVDAVPHYAALRAHLEGAGTPIGPNDLWIAAHALAGDHVLVTNNEREFRRVPGLRIENWLR